MPKIIEDTFSYLFFEIYFIINTCNKIGPRAENPDHLNKQNGGDIPDVGIASDYEGKKFDFFTVR